MRSTEQGTRCSKTGPMWDTGKWYKAEKSCDLRWVTSWPLFTAINLISEETVFCITAHCFIFLFFFFFPFCLINHASFCFSDSSYVLHFDTWMNFSYHLPKQRTRFYCPCNQFKAANLLRKHQSRGVLMIFPFPMLTKVIILFLINNR